MSVSASEAHQHAQPLLDEEVDVAVAIVAALADAGIEHVIGIPGGLTGPIWRALHDHPTIRPVLVREESLGSYMAEAYGRLRGRPVAVMGQGEWIVGNASQGYLESLLGSSPLVILTEMSDGGPLSHHAVYQGGSGDFGAWDTKKALEGLTKRVMVSRHPAQAVQHVQLAVKHAITGDPGPVAVVFDSASLQGNVGPDSVPRLYRSAGYLGVPRPGGEPEDVAFVLDALRNAERPVIIAGNGVRVGGACERLAELAQALDVPVVTTAHGKGVVDERASYAGGVIGAFGWPAANDLLGGADVVLAIGTKLGTMDTIDENTQLLNPRRQLLIQVDVDPLMLGWTTPVARAVLADALTFIERLLKDSDVQVGQRANGAAARVAALKGEEDQARTSDEVPFTPQRVVAAMNRLVPENAIVTADAGENRLFMMRWYASKRPGGYLQPAAGGGMGHAVPAALGAKLAHPDAPVVAVCGDGGFAMSLNGLMTAVEAELPIAVVILNNRALGWVLHGMGEKVVAAEFAAFDHAAIARALGCDGVSASTPAELEEALGRIPSLQRPLVIDVPVGMATSFRDILDPIDTRRAQQGGY
jgi:acetolactate synthase-1/2/3 large subunit